MIKAGQAYDQRNEFEHRDDVARELANTYRKNQDLIIPYGKTLGFNGTGGEQVTLSYDGSFKVTIDGLTVVELATDSALTTLESTVEDNTASITTNASAIATVESSLSTLSSEVVAAREGESSLLAKVNVMESATVSAAGAASTAQSEVTAARQGEASLTAKVTALSSATSTVDGKLSASYAVTVDAGGRIASMKLLSDGTTSAVKFKATAFQFYDGSSDRALIDATAGVLTINGDIAVSGSIAVGEVRWPVALQTKKILGVDNASIQWASGAALSAIPEYLITVPSGVALAAGEAWEAPTLSSVTTTGGTLRLKISTPGATASVTDTTDAAGGGGNPNRVMAKADSADAYDGIYNIRVQGTVDVTSVYDSGIFQYYHYGQTELSTWFNDGGGWDEGPPITVSVVDVLGTYQSGVDETGSHAFDVTVSIAWSNAVGQHGGYEWGVSHESGGSITDFVSVQYIKQTATGTRTGSPNGETATILVLPRNV